MKREEAIKQVREWDFLSKDDLETLAVLVPELRESEDERIGKEIIDFLKVNGGIVIPKKWIAYLEKQKVNTDGDFARGYDCGYECCLNSHGAEWIEKRKEQKNVDTQNLPHWKRMIGACGSGDDFVKPFLIRYGKGVYAQANCVGPNDVYIDLVELEKLPMPNDVIEDNSSITKKDPKPKHFELKAGKWYFCHRAYCCRADHITVKEGERFQCEKDGIVRGFVITEPEKYFKECSAPPTMEEKQKEQPTDAKLDRVIKAARRVLNNWLDGTDCPDVSGDFAELEYALREYDGEEKQEEPKPVEWKPQAESLEALMYAIEGQWEKIKPTSYLSRRLEDLYEGLVNTFNVDESLIVELPKVASRTYTAEDIEELRELKRKIEESMEPKPVEWSEEDERMINVAIRSCKQTIEDYPSDAVRFKDCIIWLKSLRSRPIKADNWKPSNGQMEALDNARFCKAYDRSELDSLYEDLKKLM